MRWFPASSIVGWQLLLVLLCASSVRPLPAETQPPDLQLQLGERIYRNGQLGSGEPLQARVQGDVSLEGMAAACNNCHRRSGMGSMEGQRVVPAVTEAALYAPGAVMHEEFYRVRNAWSEPRPAYDDRSLARAIRDGIDAAGKPLDALMPRYPLDQQSMTALISYLKTLSRDFSPGVDSQTVHFASVIGPGVDASRHQAQLDILEAYMQVRNRRTRAERRRAEKAPFHKAWKYQAYRDWSLHLWELQGSPEDWPRQLAAHYQRQPVFAVLGGLVTGDWSPVHDFCREQQLPCLFPDTDQPSLADNDFYNLYFSRGISRDAGLLAVYLDTTETGARQPWPLLQVYRPGSAGELAARQLRQSLAATPGLLLADVKLDAAIAPDPDFWQNLVRHPPETLVLWLEDRDLVHLDTLAIAPDLPRRIYLDSRLLRQPFAVVPEDLRSRVRLVHPYSLPAELEQRGRQAVWLLKGQGKVLSNTRLQVNSLFTLRLAGEAMMHIRGNFYRDYFIERIEHIVDRLGSTAAYPRLSLGPGQRYATEGGYLVSMGHEPGDLVVIRDLLRPLVAPPDLPR